MAATEVLILGSEGSMGTRYKAILKYLGVNYSCYDSALENTYYKELPVYNHYSHIIIATPTSTHYGYINSIGANYKGAVLCEKPIVIGSKIDFPVQDLSMVFQYAYLAFKNPIEELNADNMDFHLDDVYSIYNYFRSGKDGLIWDCLQIIALHKGSIDNLMLKNSSPEWNCILNNKRLSLSNMDNAYVLAIKDWLTGNRFDLSVIKKAHQKVEQYIQVRKQ